MLRRVVASPAFTSFRSRKPRARLVVLTQTLTLSVNPAHAGRFPRQRHQPHHDSTHPASSTSKMSGGCTVNCLSSVLQAAARALARAVRTASSVCQLQHAFRRLPPCQRRCSLLSTAASSRVTRSSGRSLRGTVVGVSEAPDGGPGTTLQYHAEGVPVALDGPRQVETHQEGSGGLRSATGGSRRRQPPRPRSHRATRR